MARPGPHREPTSHHLSSAAREPGSSKLHSQPRRSRGLVPAMTTTRSRAPQMGWVTVDAEFTERWRGTPLPVAPNRPSVRIGDSDGSDAAAR